MGMVVQHNMQSMNANRMLNITTGQQAKSTEKLSSGYRINRAADDAAGLSISEKMRKQIKGLDRATSNAQDGVSAVQTAEGALTEVHSMLQRMNELATQASNGTNSEDDRQSIQNEIAQLTTEIDRVAETTKFNETYLLKGEKTTYQKTLAGHDAGLKGTFVDSSDKATLTVDLSVGKNVSIAGQNYNIAAYDGTSAAKYQDSSDSLSKLQNDIKNITTDKATVTLDSTTYTYDAASKTFDAGTGTTYSAEELAGKLTDGATVAMNTDGDKATGKNGNEIESVIVRDYTNTQTNISAENAADKMVQALTQANNIGATSKAATVEADTIEHEPAKVATLLNNPEATATANANLIIKDIATGDFVNVGNGDDIKEYADSTKYAIYKAVTNADIDASNKNTSNIVIEHTADTDRTGVKEYAVGAATAGTTDGFAAAGAAAAGYAVYQKVNDITEAATVTGATTKASATLGTADKVSVSFESIDTTDTAKAKDMVDGQNALIQALKDKTITLTYTDANGAGKFSHGDVATDLDIKEDGKVYYKDRQIATLTSTAGNGGSTAGNSVKLGTAATPAFQDAKYVQIDEKPAGSEYTFTINKGQTEVPDDLTLNLHVGADADMTNKISVGIASMDSKGLGISGINVADDSGVAATYAIDAIEDAIKTVSAQRSALGAVQNRLEHTIANLDNVVENTTSAESAIRDTDMASEMVNFSKNNILAQAGQSMLAQANQSNQGVLSLLG